MGDHMESMSEAFRKRLEFLHEQTRYMTRIGIQVPARSWETLELCREMLEYIKNLEKKNSHG